MSILVLGSALMLAVSANAQNRFSSGQSAFAQAAHLRHDLAEAHYGLGLEYFGMNRYKDSPAAFREAVRLRPEMAKAHYRLALVYQELEKIDLLTQECRILETFYSGLAKQLTETSPQFNLPSSIPRYCK